MSVEAVRRKHGLVVGNNIASMREIAGLPMNLLGLKISYPCFFP